MRKVSVMLATALMLVSPVVAQESTHGPERVGTVFGSLGGMSDGSATLFHVGAGEEVVWSNGLGIGADFGYISSASEFGEGVFLLTAGPIYEFSTGSRYRPFVRGGVSLVMGQGGSLPLMHIGGGLNQRFGERWGLKLEVRDHLHPRYPGFQVVEFTAGLLFSR